jgi:hypothetical protein
MNCSEIISEIYQSKAVNELISKIEPKDLQNDLKQEIALELLQMDCEKIKRMYHANELTYYTIRMILNIGTGKNNNFFKKFKQKDKINDYLYIQQGKEIPIHLSALASNILSDKLNSDPYSAHEAIIFNKFVELGNLKKVAEYFNIPHLHVFQVVKKTKAELKKALNNNN